VRTVAPDAGPDFAFPREWQQVKMKKRQMASAWGPTLDRRLTHSATLVFVWPGALPAGPTLLNGTAVSWQGAERRMYQLPAEVSVGDYQYNSLQQGRG